LRNSAEFFIPTIETHKSILVTESSSKGIGEI
jgi:hypothetical protein